MYYKKGLYESAVVELSDSAEKMPNNAMVQYHLGMALYKAEKGDRGKAALEKVLVLDPKFEKAGEVRTVLKSL